MKLAARDLANFFARPDPNRAGVLIYGPDVMRVALKRQELIAALIGPQGDAEMRLTRIEAGELKADPAQLTDAMRAQGFFPGQRVVFVEDATDGLAKTVEAAVSDWRAGDAQLVITARALKPTSALRKLFEKHTNAVAAAIYDDPPSRDQIEADLRRAGIATTPEGMADLAALARSLEPGDFRQTLEKLALYKMGDQSPVAPEDIAACAPASTEAALDDVLHIVAEARVGEIGAVMRRLKAQGVQPVGLCIGATRHFRTLHSAASDPGGPSVGISRLRPPLNFKVKDRMERQATQWGMHRLEQALSILTETDLQLRSSSRAPDMALVERALIRLAMLGGR